MINFFQKFWYFAYRQMQGVLTIFCSWDLIKSNVFIKHWKLIRKLLIWAVSELSGVNRSQDMVVLRFWKILGYEKIYNFGFLRQKMTSYRKTNDFFLLGGCEPFFVKISPRNGEKSKFLRKFFWTISQRHIAYHLSWEITYFCAKFQLLTLLTNSFCVYKEHTDRHTDRHTEI